MKITKTIKRLIISAFFFVFLANVVYSQSSEIRGSVTDSENTGIPGVTLSIKGKSIGTITDINGNYKITANVRDTIIFSYIGYEKQEIIIGNKKVIHVTLRENLYQLDEIVVVGYNQMKKKDLLGAVSSIQAKDLEKIPVGSATEAITGKLAGVQVTTSEGAPGADIKIRVRGGTSITQDNAPLYIIDGFPSDLGLEGVSPNDIQSIDVLKDASSTSIYGSRGANGVIIVTTKKGEDGLRVTYNGYGGFRNVSKTLRVQTPYEFVKTQWERMVRNSNASPSSEPDMSTVISQYGEWADYSDLYMNAPYINWQDEIFGRTAKVQSHNVTINGGSKNTKYNFNYTRNDEEGIMINSGFKSNYYKFRFDQSLTNFLKFNASMNYLESVSTGAGTTDASDVNGRLINILQYRPVGGINKTNDSLFDDDLDLDSEDALDFNPITMANNTDRNKYRTNLQMNAGFDVNISKNIIYKILAGMNRLNNSTESLYDVYSYYAVKAGGVSATLVDQSTNKWNISNTLTYNLKKDIHDLNIMLGQEANQMELSMINIYANKFKNSDIVFGDLSGAETHLVTSDKYKESLFSLFGRINYSLKNRYLFSASLRHDGSSKFSSGKQFQDFPAAAVAWRISDEPFFNPVSPVSNLKVRYSYGSSGNNRIDNFLYMDNFKTVYYGLNNTSTVGVIPNELGNSDLKWETTYTNNIGVDVGLFKNRLNFVAEMYVNNTKNLLLDTQISSTSGFTTQMKNIGSTENKGIELTLNASIIATKNFTWDAGLNISFNKNKIVSLDWGENWKQDHYVVTSNWGYMSGDYLVQVGEPLGLMYGYVQDGIYTANDFKDVAFETGMFTPGNLKDDVPYAMTQSKETNLLGQIKIKRFSDAVDENGHPVASVDEDKTIIGNANPTHFGGFNTALTYKGFDLNIFLNWTYGNDIYNATKLRGSTQMYSNKNVLSETGIRYTMVEPETGARVLDRDRLNELNANATLPAISQKAETLTDWAIEDGSFLRLNTISLGYNLSKSILKKMRLRKLRVYATGYNLYTFTNYTGYDPEVDSRLNTVVTPGLDYNAYPRSRQFIFGINITY